MSSGIAMIISNAPVFNYVGGRPYMGVVSGAHGQYLGYLGCVLSPEPPRRPCYC